MTIQLQCVYNIAKRRINQNSEIEERRNKQSNSLIQKECPTLKVAAASEAMSKFGS